MIISPNDDNAPPEGRGLGYDLNYILRSFNLLPIAPGAINAGAIVWVEIRENGHAVFHLHGGHTINLTAEQMTTFEQAIHTREAEAQRIRAEAIERDAKLNMEAQIKAGNEAIAQAAMMNKLNRSPRGS